MKRLHRDERELVALALANGGNPEEEYDAAEAVFDMVGWPVAVGWRVECAAYGQEGHQLHRWGKPSEERARKACESNDNDPAMVRHRPDCIPFHIVRVATYEREVPR